VRPLVRTLETLSEAAGYLAGGVVFALTVLIAASVVSRRLLGAPLLAVDELSGYLLLALVSLGLSYTMKAGGHIRADVLLAHLPPRPRQRLETAATVVALLFAGALLAGVWTIVAEYYQRGTLSFKYLQVPLWIPASLLVVGAVLLLLQIGACLVRCFAAASDPAR
jgi:TRAP-type C4-dicarboxylate transport system permease small subunit